MQYTDYYKGLADLVEREIKRDGRSKTIVGKEIITCMSICELPVVANRAYTYGKNTSAVHKRLYAENLCLYRNLYQCFVQRCILL